MPKLIVLVCIALFLTCQSSGEALSAPATDLSGYDFVHDPSRIKEGHISWAPDGWPRLGAPLVP